MTRTLAIVLAAALLCAVGAWFVSHRSMQALPSLATAEEGGESQTALDAGSLPLIEARAARTDLTTLVPVALKFAGPAATLSLEVVDAQAKLPIPDVAVSVLEFPEGGSRSEMSTWDSLAEAGDPPQTDASGRLALRVPANRLLCVAVSGTSLRTECRSQEIPALAESENRTVTLEVAEEGDLHVFGRVVDGGTHAAIAGVAIQLERRPSIEPLAITDADGRFELRTNSWESRLAHASKRGFLPLAFEVDGQHDSASRAQQLVLLRAATVQGFYRDCDESPVAEGSLRFWTSSGFAAHVYPREDGWFEADSLPTGEAVKVDLDLEHRPIVREVASVLLAPGELRRIDWKLPPRFPVKGIVLDELGAPVQGCELALYFGNAADTRCLGWKSGLDERDSCTSDADGRFAFAKAGQGSWVVALLRIAGRSAFLRDPISWKIPLAAQNIAISGPETEEIVLRCWMHTTVQGRVVDPDDHPVPRAQVHVELAGCDASVERWVGADGSFSVHVPGPGTYELSVEPNEWFLRSEKLTVRAGERDSVLRLKRAPVLRVRVIDEQTREPLQAQVFGIGASGSRVAIWGFLGDNDPTALVTPCPADSYRLFARSFDGRCGTLDGVSIDADSSTREWTISVAPGRNALVRSSHAGGPIEVCFSWNGIPIDEEEIRKDSKVLVSVPPGTLSTRYRHKEPPGDWHALDTSIDDSRLVEIDLPFP